MENNRFWTVQCGDSVWRECEGAWFLESVKMHKLEESQIKKHYGTQKMIRWWLNTFKESRLFLEQWETSKL